MTTMAAPANGSPIPASAQLPHKNTALAPSQELAYRSKCIELRRRLTEIERSNDDTRRRIQRERKAHDKMRLNRAILLHHLKEMMGEGGRVFVQAEVRTGNGTANELNAEQVGAKAYAEDDTDGTEEEEITEPQERPLRSKRTNHRGDITMNVTPAARASNVKQSSPDPQSQTGVQETPSQSNNLPALAPSSPVQSQGGVQSSFRVTTPTPGASNSPPTDTIMEGNQSQASNGFAESNPPPTHPVAPFDRYFEIHSEQLRAEGAVAPESISSTIRKMWNDAPEDDKKAAEEEYQEQMQAYEKAMDEWKKAKKAAKEASAGGTTPGSSFKTE